MSFGFPQYRGGYFPAPNFYKENLEFKVQLHAQLDVCRKRFNEEDLIPIYYAVDTLLSMVLFYLKDDQFISELENLINRIEADYRAKEADYRSKIASAACPDVVPKPIRRPNRDHLKEMFIICENLFDRKDLMLKKIREDYL